MCCRPLNLLKFIAHAAANCTGHYTGHVLDITLALQTGEAVEVGTLETAQ